MSCDWSIVANRVAPPLADVRGEESLRDEFRASVQEATYCTVQILAKACATPVVYECV